MWSPLPLYPPPGSAEVLAEILDGGQAFRWHAMDGRQKSDGRMFDRIWTGTWATHAIDVEFHEGSVRWRPSSAFSRPSSEEAVRDYFDASRDYLEVADRLPWRSDGHLALSMSTFPGLRILRQPFGETLLGFLCSATKQIVQIKEMLDSLAGNHGNPLALQRSHERERVEPAEASTRSRSLLPGWDVLAKVTEGDLRACKLGFRAGFIHQTGRFLAARPGWLEETEALPYHAAKARLLELPGVGEKIADCVLLYGAGKLEAFPVDTWILKAMGRRYGLHRWKPSQVAHFGRTHFGPFAGLAQQYLFNYERRKEKAETLKH